MKRPSNRTRPHSALPSVLSPAICGTIGLVTCAVLVWAAPPVVDRAGKADQAEGSNQPIMLDEPELTESSGLAFSRRHPGCVWTHNDSGGDSVVYAFNPDGKATGRANLALPNRPVDWEDIASFAVDGEAKLLVADCGDNGAKRTAIRLHFIEEPDPTQTNVVTPVITLNVTYPDGPRDCEAVVVDERSGQVYLFTKSFLPTCGVYSVAMPSWPADQDEPEIHSVTAIKRTTLTIPLITAADVDSVTGDLMLAGYFQGYRFRRHDASETIETMLHRLPEPVTLAPLKQIEAIAFDDAGQAWVTSEGSPAPMQRLVTETNEPNQ